jgi:hypothetical protein
MNDYEVIVIGGAPGALHRCSGQRPACRARDVLQFRFPIAEITAVEEGPKAKSW